ncbi:hypothetical protein UB45_10960 [Terrabacter sp. 28]|nr:hypothetical protein UB45_10960 [Terrabacter sp. 28]
MLGPAGGGDRPARGLDGAEGGADDDGVVVGDVVELRVHGVNGTPATDILDDAAPRQVAGDQAGRVWRRSVPAKGPGERVRDVEAFHWAAFTKLNVLRFLWLILIPFTLVNLASYALLIERQDPDAAAVRTRWWQVKDATALRIVRLLGMTMTLQMVATTCYIGWQTGLIPWEWNPGLRLLAGGALPTALVLALWWFGKQSYDQDPAGGHALWVTERGAIFDRGFWSGSSSCPRRLEQHVIASLGLIGVIGLWRSGTPWEWSVVSPAAKGIYWVLHVACAAVSVVCIVGVCVHHDETKSAFDGDNPPEGVAAKAGRQLFGPTLGLIGAVLVVLWYSGDHPPGGGPTGEPPVEVSATAPEVMVTVIAIVLVALLFVLTLANLAQVWDPVGRRLRRGVGKDPVPGAFRPYWGGMAATILTILAVGVASGFSAAAFRWAQGADAPIGAAAVVFSVGAICWGVMPALAVVAALPIVALLRNHKWAAGLWLVSEGLLGVAIWRDWGEFGLASWADLAYAAPLLVGVAAAKNTFTRNPPLAPHLGRLLGLPSGDAAEDERVSPEERRRRRQVLGQLEWAQTRRYYHRVLGLAAVAAAGCVAWQGVAAAMQLVRWQVVAAGPGDRLPPNLGIGDVAVLAAPERFGTWVIGLLATGVGALALLLWRNPNAGTTVGVVFDLLSLWPRVGHPLCPPPYGGRAVLGVATRASQLANTRTPGDYGADVQDESRTGNGYRAVVISGHSQGSLVSLAAVAVLKRAAVNPEDPRQEKYAWLNKDAAGATMKRLALLTYGSQLQFIYARLFPGYLGFHVLRGQFRESLGGRWKNLHRWTDPIGGPVLAWPNRNDFWTGQRAPSPATEKWSWMANRGSPAKGVATTLSLEKDEAVPELGPPCAAGEDVQLQDPLMLADSAYYPRLPARGHGDYWLDPYFGAVVWKLAKESVASGPAELHNQLHAIGDAPKAVPAT